MLLACELEGKSRREAAQQLGVPEGTVSSDLSRGRKLLRERLERRGVSMGALPMAGLARDAAMNTVPATLASATAQTAVRVLSGAASAGSVPASVALLMKSVRRAMLMNRLVMTAGAGATLGGLVLAGVLLAEGAGVPMLASQKETKPSAQPRVSSSIDGETLRMNIDVPLDRVNPDTVILRGHGRQVELAVGPRVVRRFEGHNGPVSAVAIAPDGKRILSASGWPRGDRTIRLWDVAKGSEDSPAPARNQRLRRPHARPARASGRGAGHRLYPERQAGPFGFHRRGTPALGPRNRQGSRAIFRT